MIDCGPKPFKPCPRQRTVVVHVPSEEAQQEQEDRYILTRDCDSPAALLVWQAQHGGNFSQLEALTKP
jgi:hypothetical protein